MSLRPVLVIVIVLVSELAKAGNYDTGIIPGVFFVSSFVGYLQLNSFEQNCFFCRNAQPEIQTPSTPSTPKNQAVIQHIINCPVSTAVPTPTNNPSQSVGNEQTSSLTANFISLTCNASGDNDKGNNDGMPPDSSIAVCEVCNNCHTAPGEKRCIHCLSADNQETPAEGGASPPVCVRCGKCRDGQLRDNQWICHTCFVPHNDLMTESGVFGVNECMVCTFDDGILYHIACKHGFLIHTDCLAGTPEGTIRCPQCQRMVGITPAESTLSEFIFEPPTVEPTAASPSQADSLPFCVLSDLEQQARTEALTADIRRNGISVSTQHVLQVLRANPWLTYDLAQSSLTDYFQSPEVRHILESQNQPQVDPAPTTPSRRQRRCIIQ